MNVEDTKPKRKWRSLAWLDAVFAATNKIRVIRVAHALFKSCDSETGETWAGRDRIHRQSRIVDLDNFRKALKELQEMGAIEVLPFEDMPDAMKATANERGKSHDGVWFRMSFAWSDEVISSDNKAGQNDRNDPVKMTAEERSNRPESAGQIDPPYLLGTSSPPSSIPSSPSAVPCGPPSQSLRSAGFDSSFQSESHATAAVVGARSL